MLWGEQRGKPSEALAVVVDCSNFGFVLADTINCVTHIVKLKNQMTELIKDATSYIPASNRSKHGVVRRDDSIRARMRVLAHIHHIVLHIISM